MLKSGNWVRMMSRSTRTVAAALMLLLATFVGVWSWEAHHAASEVVVAGHRAERSSSDSTQGVCERLAPQHHVCIHSTTVPAVPGPVMVLGGADTEQMLVVFTPCHCFGPSPRFANRDPPRS